MRMTRPSLLSWICTRPVAPSSPHSVTIFLVMMLPATSASCSRTCFALMSGVMLGSTLLCHSSRRISWHAGCAALAAKTSP